MENIFKVAAITQKRSYTTDSDGKLKFSRDIVLQTPGGSCADEFVCPLYDENADKDFRVGDIVLASISSYVYQGNDHIYQQMYVREIDRLDNVKLMVNVQAPAEIVK